MKGKGRGLAACLLCVLSACLLASCSGGQDSPVVIWSDRAEFASYVELFNATHDIKAVLVYKDGVSRSLPPARDEMPPDLVIGSWLKTSSIRKNFLSAERFFGKNNLHKDAFYGNLLEYGSYNGKSYLLPVSFNLPAVVFAEENSSYLDDSHIASLSQIREADKVFSLADDKGVYQKMGFAPSWDRDFLYLVAKSMGSAFAEGGSTFLYDRASLESAVNYIKEWTLLNHGSSSAEQDFKFSYLYRPESKWLSTGRNLFVYMTSCEFYTINEDSDTSLSFRWVSTGSGIPLEDDIVCMGLYRKTKNPGKAGVFVNWFFQEASQKAMMERYHGMELDTQEFGIAGGFSSVKLVNESLFPAFYHGLLGNIPMEEQLILPEDLPSRYSIFKERIIIPFLVENCQASGADNAEQDKARKSLDDYIADWSRQAF
ncbi:MAG: hypothetical protein IJU95_07195 [Treponema sp.]|nr:hypothetical protein [Treponema sp.]